MSIQEVVVAELQVKQVDGFSKYLGLPTIVGKNNKDVLNYVVDKVLKRIQGWKKRFLNRAGKEILIKIVAQAVPNYLMPVFLLPLGIVDNIEKALNGFSWRSSNDSGIHWAAWHRLARSKEEGGLGFRRLRDFNVAFLLNKGGDL